MRVGFIITGRMKSTRLPKKLTLKIQNKEIIKWMILRAKLVFKNEDIVIATSTNPQDDILEDIAKEMDIKIFRGHEDDVVLRLFNTAVANNFDYFINITADCPLFGFDYIERIKALIMKTESDLITSLELPHGIFVYAIKTEAFRKVIDIKRTDNTEVWGDYFYENPDIFKTNKIHIEEKEKRPNFRLTIDYQEDLEVFEKIFDHFGQETFKKSSEEIIHFLDNNPEIVKINSKCIQKYQERWKSQTATRLEKGLE